MGNVFLSFDNDIFFNKIAAYSPYSAAEIRQLVVQNLEISREFDSGKISSAEFYGKVKGKLQAEIGQRDFFVLYNDIFVLRQKELDLLNRLRRHYRLVLLSNTDVERYGFILKQFPQIKIFDAYVLSYEAGFIKPDSRIYESAVVLAGVLPQECLFIDDLAENIRGAELLGINTIHYTAEKDLVEELRGYRLRF